MNARNGFGQETRTREGACGSGVWAGMQADGRARPTLAADLVGKLRLCAERLKLPRDCETQEMIVTVLHDLADRFLEATECTEPAAKKPRGSTTAAGRDFCSEVALSDMGWSVTDLKRRECPGADVDHLRVMLNSLSGPLRQLVLLVPETPRSSAEVSREAVVSLLWAGLQQHDLAVSERLKEELARLDSLAVEFFAAKSDDKSLSTLSKEFASSCPNLRSLFSELVMGPHTHANTVRTEDVKMEWMVVLASAIGKVRNSRRCGMALALYALWKSLGVPVEAINILGNLGLSLSASDGAMKMAVQVKQEREALDRELGKKHAAEECCIVFDNIDYMLGTQSFVKSEVDVRSRLIHVTAASAVFFRLTGPPVPTPSAVPFVRPKLLISALFADSDCQKRVVAEALNVIHSVLHNFGIGFIGCKSAVAPIQIVDCGTTERSRRQSFPIFWLEEGKIDHMYKFVNDVAGKFKSGSRVHFVGDCFSLQKLLSVRELIIGQTVRFARPDLDAFGIVLVPGFFHLYWNVFLGSLLQSDRDLLEEMVEIANLKNVRLHNDIGTCFNDMDHLVRLLFPVAVARLFAFFRDIVARRAEFNLKKMSEKDVMICFTAFITQTVQGLARSGQTVKEWQRLCRVVLLLSIYRSLRIAIATENHSVLMDMLYFCVSLVCIGSFKQYRKIVIEAVAHYARSSPEERQTFVRSFTGNYSGGRLGGRAMDEIREFDNKATKENLRRNHRCEGDLAPELELTERHREIRLIFSSAFPALNAGSGGAIPDLPPADEVLGLAARAQWSKMTRPLADNVALKQKAFFTFGVHESIVKETLVALHRGSQL